MHIEHFVDGGVVKQRAQLPGTDDVVVLLDPERRPDGVRAWHPFHNILRVSPTGEVLWRADLLPEETAWKCWLGIVEAEPTLRVWTASYEATIDSETGRIVDSTFTK